MSFEPNGIVTLTTDFGTRDGYVGAMKGAMLSAAPGVRLIDLAHDLPAQGVVAAAMALRAACPRFPVGTVHLAVIDPGVGTERAAMVARAGGHAFVGPDNGLLMPALLAVGGPIDAWRIAEHRYLDHHRSATFHGRDLFGPTAAALAAGNLRIVTVGESISPMPLSLPQPRQVVGGLEAVVTTVDRFGNLLTCANASDLAALTGEGDVHAELTDGRSLRFVLTYGEANPGETVALIGSDGDVEIAVRNGSAAANLGLGPGDTVRLSKGRRD